MSDILLIIGLGVFIVGGLAYLIAAFKTNLLWGLGCLIFAPVSLVYLFMHWESAKKPFLIQISGLAIVIVTSYLQGSLTL